MERSVVFDSYWRFAAERLRVYFNRLARPAGPWTDDPILRSYRFTNTYRAADRVSQYLMREVQYRDDRSQAPAELFFRTILFKLFNRIETWELVERELVRDVPPVEARGTGHGRGGPVDAHPNIFRERVRRFGRWRRRDRLGGVPGA